MIVFRRLGWFCIAATAALAVSSPAVAQYSFLGGGDTGRTYSNDYSQGRSGRREITFGDAMDAFNYGDSQLAARYLWPLAEGGDARAQYYLAYLLDTGQGAGKDLYAAVKWYEKAAKQHYLPAVAYMGYVYSSGHGVKRDDKEAFRWYTQAAQMGDAISQNNLATMLRTGRPYRKNPELAAQWFLQAALQGNARSQYNLAVMYLKGEGAPKNPGEAVRWFTYAAMQGDRYAQSMLAYLYRKGDVVEKNDAQALDWYRRAAEQGYMAAQYNLAVMYEKGLGGSGKDLLDAAIWYFHAAKQGSPRAQLRLGAMYEKGEGLPQNYDEAMAWYKKAAEKEGDAIAMVAMGRLLEKKSQKSRKPDDDLRNAVMWYRRAAEAGEGLAQLELGRMYRLGIGVEKNLPMAYKWYALADNLLKGDLKIRAAMARSQISEVLTPHELSTARGMVDQWVPRNPLGMYRGGLDDGYEYEDNSG